MMVKAPAVHARMMQVIRAQGLTQAVLWRALGATSPTAHDWFKHGAVPGPEMLGQFCLLTKTDAHWLLTGQHGGGRCRDCHSRYMRKYMRKLRAK